MNTHYSVFISVIVALLFVNCSRDASDNIPGDWIHLFDGESTEHWRGYNMDSFPGEAWRVEDGELVFYPGHGQGLDIITKEQFSNFEFRVEWMIEEAGNSGIFHHVVEQPDQAIFWSGLEMQILDDAAFSDLQDSQYAGSLYDIKAAEPRNTRPHGEWNTVRIISDGSRLEYWQNGEKVVETERWTAEWYEMIRGTKFECHPSFGNAPKGHIGLQDHGDVVRFRNIKIRKL
jgi:hypothetical protein